MYTVPLFVCYTINDRYRRAELPEQAAYPEVFYPSGADIMFDKTMTFSVNEDKEAELRKNLTIIYDALIQKGYNPINQIVGYILSEDPTYITTYNNARSLIRHIDRDELLQVLVRAYLNS